jgi:hypothetical protein
MREREVVVVMWWWSKVKERGVGWSGVVVMVVVVVVRGHLSLSLLPLSSPTCSYVLPLLTSILSSRTIPKAGDL